MKFFRKKEKGSLVDFKSKIGAEKPSGFGKFFRKSHHDAKPEVKEDAEKYIGQTTNSVMLIILVSAILILVGATLYFQFFLGGVSTEKGSIESRLRQVENELNSTLLNLGATKEKLSTATGDVSKIGDLYNSTAASLGQTQSELDTTKTSLASTQSELDTTKSELSTTKSQLNSTQATLVIAQGDLASTKSKLEVVCSYMKGNSNLTHANCP